MVYRGKPSAGCENCRKAKKRCTLELPACVRCVKLKKQCVGYRDTSQLQIQDETQSVLQKVGRKKTAHPGVARIHSTTTPVAPAPTVTTPQPAKIVNGTHTSSWQVHDFNTFPQQASPALTNNEFHSSNRSVSSDKHSSSTSPISNPYATPLTTTSGPITTSLISMSAERRQLDVLPELRALGATAFGTSANSMNFNMSNVFSLIQWASGIPKSPQPLPDNVAIDFFLQCCTAEGQWSYYHQPDFVPGRDSCLDYAIKACGMAALNNIRPLPGGLEWSRSMYTKAIGLLNEALRDPVRSKKDDSLVAVTMLGFYENLVCDSMQSVKSWKAHIDGATQLLKLRGKAQFATMSGRQLFRELRGHILVACIWDDRKPPDFLRSWQHELTACSTQLQFIGPVDELATICFDLAEMKHKVMLEVITAREALEEARKLDGQLVQWAIRTPQRDARWQYSEIKVTGNPHVWNDTVMAYSGLPIPGAWNMYRSVRILLSRTTEVLARSLAQSDEERRTQILYARAVRKEMTDEICSTIPCLLGHAAPAFNSPCVLISAYQSIWPLFFAATSVLERLGLDMFEKANEDATLAHSGVNATAFTTAAAQSAWLLSRLDYISGTLGVKWADGIAGSLREAIQVHKNKLFTAASDPNAPVEYLSIVAEIVKGVMAWRNQMVAYAK